ncbi:MAG: hypothetical protein H6Q89_2920, partial [Myxococcaceae bacterium]|nr:hypothetical protein [Myxococcaceae bacterium]
SIVAPRFWAEEQALTFLAGFGTAENSPGNSRRT